MEIILENVRCFQKNHRVSLTPITILVGENSSGKSTFLAILSALKNSTRFPFVANFNNPPYDLGNYENIATRNPKKSKPASFFKIGFCVSDSDSKLKNEAVATYQGLRGEVSLSEFCVKCPQGSMSLKVEKRSATGSFLLTEPNAEPIEIPFTYKIPDIEADSRQVDFVPSILSALVPGMKTKAEVLLFPKLVDVMQGSVFPAKHVQSIAPIRSKPRRTYDQFNEEFKPEGDHVPLKLARLFESDEEAVNGFREKVKASIEAFGKESGLFNNVRIERFGNKSSAPFQVEIQQDGLALNLIDVGYGVSQSLPIIVQSLISKGAGILLMQQPEVHLHPRAQAALGTFFAQLTKTNKIQFIIETHSDYLLDRIRQEVANGTIKASSVSILFFEKKKGFSKIHKINVDDQGNVVNVPPGYREFFLGEEIKLLTRGQS